MIPLIAYIQVTAINSSSSQDYGKHKDITHCTLDTIHYRCSIKNKLSLHRAGWLPQSYLQNLSVFTAQRMSNRSCAVFPVMALS